MDYTLNCNGQLLSLNEPQVMGILNVTPDSFYADSRKQTEHDVAKRTEEILSQGGTMIDVGACSTRPDSEAVISVDTFRPQVARIVVEEFGADIINDVGAPANSQFSIVNCQFDMFRMVSRLRVPYIFMSRKSTIRDILLDSAEAVDQLRSMGQKDIIIDPGFGFGKTLEQNYEVMQHMERLQMLQLPLLVGISRKSMIYKLLQTNPEQALNGTTTLHTIALLKGANILRVHDVHEAVECVKIVAATKSHFTLNRN